MPKPKIINETRCPACGLFDDWMDNPLWPYCSEVCRLLFGHGLAWRVQPYRIAVNSYRHLIVQAGPRFDLRESALKGARGRALAAERKRRQRAVGSLLNVTLNEQSNASIGRSFSISAVENWQETE